MNKSVVKEHSMLFKGPMICAFQREVDPKEQTRRPITFDNSITDCRLSRKSWDNLIWSEAWQGKQENVWLVPFKGVPTKDMLVQVSPRIKAGDLVWSKETFASLEPGTYEDMKPDEQRSIIRYKEGDALSDLSPDIRGYKYRPSIFMPRWASRMDFDVRGVRTQRIQDISEEDAHAEGIMVFHHVTDDGEDGYFDIPLGKGSLQTDTPSEAFHALWDSINIARGFGVEDNHPVWAYDLKRVSND